MSEEETATAEALRAEYERLEEAHAEADELPEEVDQRLGEIETALAALDERPIKHDPEEVARAGAFVSIDGSGELRVERGYVRPEDEPALPEHEPATDAASSSSAPAASGSESSTETQAITSVQQDEPEEEEGIKPIPDRLMSELTAYRTLALRDALAQDPDVAFLAVLHALCLKLFYRYTPESCLDIDAKSVVFGSQAPGLNDTVVAKALDDRHRHWSEQLPRESGDLWDALIALDPDSRDALFAHCVALSVNAVYEPWNRRPRALAHADRIAEAVRLDVAATGWSPSVDNYLGRVTKARIVQAVREAKGETAAQLVEHLKKGDMAERAQELLAGSGWLPEPLRTPGRAIGATSPTSETSQFSGAAGEESAARGYETAVAHSEAPAEDAPVLAEQTQVAAE
jgi:ParB family transcriptional regulator, chromosome partitioning protein